MKLKYLLLFLSFLLPASVLSAEEREEPFTLNGRPVPDVVAKVNGVPLLSQVLERDLFAFRFRARQTGREIKPADEITIARELVKAAAGRMQLKKYHKGPG